MAPNLYLLEKMFSSFDYYKGKVLVHTLQQILIYIIFLFFLLTSHAWFIAGLLGFTNFSIQQPLLLIWFSSYLFYVVQLFAAQAAEKTISPFNIFLGFIAYFTYCQLFLLLYFRICFYILRQKEINKLSLGIRPLDFKIEKCTLLYFLILVIIN